MLYSLLNMKFKFIFLLLLVIPLTCAMLAQGKFADAKTSKNPVTGPITKPITYFTYKIGGIVNHKVLNLKFFQPAASVKIEALNKKTNEKFVTLTNSQGTFSLTLKEGTYTIKASDDKNTRFTPFSKTVNLNKDKLDLLFVGLIKPLPFWNR